MARQRFIWPDIWSDPVIGRLGETEMLLYIACFSLADDEGRLLGDPVWLKAQAFPYRSYSPEKVQKVRDELSNRCQSFHIYVVDGIDYIQFMNWHEFQKPKYPKPSKLPGPEHNGRQSNSRHGEIVGPPGRQWVRRGYVKNHVRAAVYARDNNQCVVCGNTKNLQIDHIVAVSKGGSNDPDNLRTLCRSCNSSKCDRETIHPNRETFLQNSSQGWVGLGRDGLDRAGLEPAEQDIEEKSREVDRILERTGEGDAYSRELLLSLTRQLPFGAVAKVRESVELADKVGVGYAVNALKSEIAERGI